MAKIWRPLLWSLLFLISPQASRQSPCGDAGGLVDLGYARHVPTYTNTTHSGRNVTIYKNIRFANPPVGDLRFRRPNAKLSKTDGIQDGNFDTPPDCISTCPEGAPFPDLSGKSWGQEDCLFLDVYVPQGVKPGDRVPVLHWFVGSAFAFGSKDMWMTPMGLFDTMKDDEPFIFVANNYRLGVAGWTAVPGLDLDANVGMHDCLAAAEWTERFIPKFGGDPHRVTVMGQSAGAAIIGMLSVLNGGDAKLPFQQAILSSPAMAPRRNISDLQNKMFDTILSSANCSSLECLRSIPEGEVMRVNHALINLPSDAGGGVLGPAPGFGPVPDGTFIPDIPIKLYQEGRFNKGIKSLIVGSMLNDGMGLNRGDGLPEYFPTMVRQIMHTASDETVAAIQALYTWGDDPAKLSWDWTTDIVFACPAYNIATAFKDRARRYMMSILPAIHGQDTFYYSYVDNETTPVANVGLALESQDWIRGFLYGKADEWPVYGTEKTIRNLTDEGVRTEALSGDFATRCDTINRALLDPANGV